MNHQGVLALPLVKVKEKFQITLPVEIREQLRLGVGDLLEASIQGQSIVLKPKDVVDRAQARQQLIEVMERVHAQRAPKTPKKRKRRSPERLRHTAKNMLNAVADSTVLVSAFLRKEGVSAVL